MKPTDFAKYLTDFMTKYLTEERGCSVNTVIAYRDAIVLLLNFFKEQVGIPAEKLTLKDITMDRILSYLEWLEKQRHCSPSTRNARLAAIHAFFRFLQYRNPEQMEEWQRIIAIKIKKAPKPRVVYLTREAIKLFLSQPDPGTKKGMRDLVMLSTMIESGARVQEIVDLTPSRVHPVGEYPQGSFWRSDCSLHYWQREENTYDSFFQSGYRAAEEIYGELSFNGAIR